MNYKAFNELLGLNVKTEDTLETIVKISNHNQYQAIFANNLNDSIKQAFPKALPTLTEDYGLYKEIMINLYGDKREEDFSDGFLKYLKNVLPTHVNVITGKNVVINKNLVIGPGAFPYVINADTLTFAGGSINVITSTITITANILEIRSSITDESSNPYHISILGDKGADGTKGADGVPYHEPAASGSDAHVPSSGICTGASAGGNADDGFPGTVGKNGQNGENGKPNAPANISIKTINPDYASSFVIFTQSGAGGKGGIGGQGGKGQDGGNGGNGCSSGCECTDGGNGGKGGNGGQGGDGGTGGNGIDGNPIIISFPSSYKNLLKPIKKSASFGDGGDPGNGGEPGEGGKAGSTGSSCSNGATGSIGKYGAYGKKGSNGSESGSPGNFIFNYTK